MEDLLVTVSRASHQYFSPALYLNGSEYWFHWAALVGASSVGLWSFTFSFLCFTLGVFFYFDRERNSIPKILILLAFLSFCLSATTSFFILGRHLLLEHPISVGIRIFFVLAFVFFAFVVDTPQHKTMQRALLSTLLLLLLPSALYIILSYCKFLGAQAIYL